MDNLCHTLVGAALGEAGGLRLTPLATATLILGANLPDVDVAALFFGPAAAVAWRRGVTHGVLALALLPPLLAVAVLAWDRRVRLRRRPDARPASPLALLGLAAVAVLTHPLLDWLNEYGMRWWMPWSGAWVYGDALFIADVWVWLALALGVLAAWRRRRRGGAHPERPARVALALVAAYVVLNLAATAAGRTAARQGFQRAGIQTGRLMVAPVPLLPFRRRVVADAGDRYVRGTIDWLRRPVFATEPGGMAKVGWIGGGGDGDGGPTGEAADAASDAAAAAAAEAAARTVDGARFLSWARFPFYRVEWLPAPFRGAGDPHEAGDASGRHQGGGPAGGGVVVWLIDARYASAPGARFGALAVRVRP